jgi:nucleoside-diphosphate-sugar epimerase
MSTRRYVITGGGGFVGKALAKALRAQGHQVVSLARGKYPELATFGVETFSVDISSDPTKWQDLLRGADGVFHTAAKVDMWGAYDDFFATNVIGTRNIIQACRAVGMRNLVFTSSPSVVHNGLDLEGVNETYPYPKHFDAFYPQTKAQAEQEVLAASDGTTLKTVALRPHLIWGPNDTNLIPTILERARAGRLTRIGAGRNLIDVTFIDDCVDAHLRAMQALEEGRSAVFGKAYFITQGDPVNMWQWIDQVLAAHGLAPVSRGISRQFATALAVIMESVARLLCVCGVRSTPLLTRFLVSEMSTHHYFSIDSARRDLGYSPSHTVKQRMQETFGVAQALRAAGA